MSLIVYMEQHVHIDPKRPGTKPAVTVSSLIGPAVLIGICSLLIITSFSPKREVARPTAVKAVVADPSHSAKKPPHRAPLTSRAAEKRYLDLLDISLEDLRSTGYAYHEDKPQTSLEVSLNAMSSDATYYAEGKKIALSAEGSARREAFRLEVGRAQAKAFPALRILQAQALDEALWEADTDVEAAGPHRTTLRFTGYHFALNRNIKQVMEQVLNQALESRFRRVEFQSFRGANVTYVTLEPLADTRLATFAFNSWTPVD